jgi:hypothetical protein
MTMPEESRPRPSAGHQVAASIRALTLPGKPVVDERLPGEIRQIEWSRP